MISIQRQNLSGRSSVVPYEFPSSVLHDVKRRDFAARWLLRYKPLHTKPARGCGLGPTSDHLNFSIIAHTRNVGIHPHTI